MDQSHRLASGHLGNVVDVLGAMRTEADLVRAGHLIPLFGARRTDLDRINKALFRHSFTPSETAETFRRSSILRHPTYKNVPGERILRLTYLPRCRELFVRLLLPEKNLIGPLAVAGKCAANVAVILRTREQGALKFLDQRGVEATSPYDRVHKKDTEIWLP